MKTKRKTILLSSIIMCLFILSSSLGVQAADPPTMTLIYDEVFTMATLPVTIDVLMHWDNLHTNYQRIVSIYIFYSISKLTINNNTYLSYVWENVAAPDQQPKRPTIMIFRFPQAGLDTNNVLRFRVEFTWKYFGGSKHTIVQDGMIKGELAPNIQLGLYAVVGICVGAAVLTILIGWYWFKRRRR